MLNTYLSKNFLIGNALIGHYLPNILSLKAKGKTTESTPYKKRTA